MNARDKTIIVATIVVFVVLFMGVMGKSPPGDWPYPTLVVATLLVIALFVAFSVFGHQTTENQGDVGDNDDPPEL